MKLVKKNFEKIYFYLLLLLVIIQPVLDVMWLNDGTISEIMGFSVPTLIRIMLIMLLAVLSFVVIKFNRKYLLLVGYLLLIGLFFIGHHYNCMQFKSLVPGNFNYNFLAEFFYIVRMCIPISVIYFTYNSRIKQGTFEKCVMIVALLMSVTVLLTNILKIGYGSYTSERILGNIFDWFTHPYDFTSNQLASKGWFYSSITSTVMVLIYPYLLYMFCVKKNIQSFLIALIHGIALFTFGTKATAFSVIIVAVIMALIYLFVTIVKRDIKISKVVCFGMIIILATSFVLLKVSPSTMKMEFDEGYAEAIDEEEQGEYELSKEDREEIIRFFDENYEYVSIKEEFLRECYPYKYDPEFWYDFYDSNVPSRRMQNRIVEEEMLKRVKEINDNKWDEWFGIGYTRTSNIYNLEKDFAYQFYSIGILGTSLLLGPYIFIVGLMIIIMLVKFKEKATLFNCAIILGTGLACFLAYYSGNVMENLGITIWIGFMLGFLLKSNFQSELMEDTNEKK